MILEGIETSSDIKKLNAKQIGLLAGEIRSFLLDSVSKTGGHLASNLGVVELTLALHAVFDLPQDKLVWDVGHQCYVHKMLTGRCEKFGSLRQFDGLSGFPKTNESEYDSFNTGHSSTSISAALGLAKARDLSGGDHHVVAVIGDGAMTGGMAYEALNNAAVANTRLIVVLNDNAMSISRNVGGLSPSWASNTLARSTGMIFARYLLFCSRRRHGRSLCWCMSAPKRERDINMPRAIRTVFMASRSLIWKQGERFS